MIIIDQDDSESAVTTETTNNQEKATDDVCAICLLELNNNIKLVECCKNKFHIHCYNSWINYSPTCPLCRSSENIQQNTQVRYIQLYPSVSQNAIYPIHLYPIMYQVNNEDFIVNIQNTAHNTAGNIALNTNNTNYTNNDETNITTCRFNRRIRICLIIFTCIIGIGSFLYAIVSVMFKKR